MKRIKIIGRTIFMMTLLLLISPKAVAQQPTDSEITRSLQQAFQHDIRLRHADIQVSIFNGSATLKGIVANYLDKYQAEQIAKRTPGIRTVVKMIQVRTSTGRDEEVASQIRRRLDQSSFIRAAEIRVDVRGGIVTLTGQVPGWAHRRQAEIAAREVRGVGLVRNNLTLGGGAVTGSPDRTHEQIQDDVQAALRRDLYLAELPIEVTVVAGVVRLEGEVPNLFHKEHAEDEARLVSNVRNVDNRLLVVSQLMLESLLKPLTDQELQQSVLDELRADPRIASGNVKATSSRGSLTLTGSVASMFERQMAERIARRVVGVVRVENLLEVSAAARSDEEIRDDVRFNLDSDSLLAGQRIEVTVKDGSVALTGEVNDYLSKMHAGRLVARVRAAQAFSNELQVVGTQPASDTAIKQLIVSQLSSNSTTRRIADRIQVTVKNGLVMLGGTVDRSVELVDAERIVKSTGGVRAVDNRMSLGETEERD